jgi:hypothetical protein
LEATSHAYLFEFSLTLPLTLSAWHPFKIKNPPCLVILQPYWNRGVLEQLAREAAGISTKLGMKVLTGESPQESQV